MDFIAPFVLAGAVAGSDYYTSRAALGRGAVETNVTAMGALKPAMFIKGAVIAAIDLGIQERAPKLKWYWRGAAVVGGFVIARHNHSTGRGRR